MFDPLDGMAKGNHRIGREITVSAKAGGPNPAYDPRQRLAIQNANCVNLPGFLIEAAIKRAFERRRGNS